jgi:hippurate hydrolase
LNIKNVIDENIEIIKELRERLYSNAELSFEEHKTQKIILEFLNSLGLDTKTMAKTGVVATLNSGENCIAIRADMDALPVNGVSHVCGHDFHMSVALGTALLLKKVGCEKCVKFIFQPGEEAEGGALPMINEGVLEAPKVNQMIGFHVWPNVKVGTIEVTSGPSMASVDDFHITFKGKGGHAAMPNLCKNPIYPAMDFIESMNIKSRIEIDPLNSHVVTFSSIQCGNAPNVIADNCKVMGTVRTFDNNLRTKLRQDIIRTANLSAEKFDCSVDINYNLQYPPVISDDLLTKRFVEITTGLIGNDKVLPLEKTFAAEDFSFFAEKVPSVHFRLGIAENNIGLEPLHSPNFSASEDCISNGIYIITNFILNL